MTDNELSKEVKRLNNNIELLLKESKKERTKNYVFWIAFLIFLIILGLMP